MQKNTSAPDAHLTPPDTTPPSGLPLYPARPTRLPSPTYWPFFMALGLAFSGWGLLAGWLVSIGGLIVFIIALIGWINALRHE